MRFLSRIPPFVLAMASAVACSRAVTPADTPYAIASEAAADSLLVDVQRLDSTIQVEMRYGTANNFTGAPLPGYDANRAFLRREAAEALTRVQRRLASRDLGLRIYDAYRPFRATTAMVEWAERTGRTALLDDGYIARRSRHNMGVAVDLTLVFRPTNEALEMGTPYDTFSEAAHTANADGEIARNRQVLVEAMAAEGFENYEMEWWHFSFPVENPVPFDRPVRDDG
jgi:D-alanyl-D-alanine dipeptidase